MKSRNHNHFEHSICWKYNMSDCQRWFPLFSMTNSRWFALYVNIQKHTSLSLLGSFELRSKCSICSFPVDTWNSPLWGLLCQSDFWAEGLKAEFIRFTPRVSSVLQDLWEKPTFGHISVSFSPSIKLAMLWLQRWLSGMLYFENIECSTWLSYLDLTDFFPSPPWNFFSSGNFFSAEHWHMGYNTPLRWTIFPSGKESFCRPEGRRIIWKQV